MWPRLCGARRRTHLVDLFRLRRPWFALIIVIKVVVPTVRRSLGNVWRLLVSRPILASLVFWCRIPGPQALARPLVTQPL